MTVVIFDIDDTLIDGQSQKIFLKYLFKHKYFGLIPFLKIYFWFILYKLGLAKNPTEVMNHAYSFVRGWKLSNFEQLVNSFWEQDLKNHLFKKSEELVTYHKKQGHYVIFISNAIRPIISKLAEYLGADYFISTELQTEGDTYTGKINGKILYGKAKVESLKKYLETSKINSDDLWVYTDHESDLPLLDIADEPIITNPTKNLRKIASARGWKILKLT